jgi:hypothetical protein
MGIRNDAFAIAIACAAISLAGCGGGSVSGGPPPPITTEILSDAGFDGNIEQTSPPTFTISARPRDVQPDGDPVSVT